MLLVSGDEVGEVSGFADDHKDKEIDTICSKLIIVYSYRANKGQSLENLRWTCPLQQRHMNAMVSHITKSPTPTVYLGLTAEESMGDSGYLWQMASNGRAFPNMTPSWISVDFTDIWTVASVWNSDLLFPSKQYLWSWPNTVVDMMIKAFTYGLFDSQLTIGWLQSVIGEE